MQPQQQHFYSACMRVKPFNKTALPPLGLQRKQKCFTKAVVQFLPGRDPETKRFRLKSCSRIRAKILLNFHIKESKMTLRPTSRVPP